MNLEQHCPFAKALFGKCCQCPHAEFYDQRTRHVNCRNTEGLRPSCINLDELLLATALSLPEIDQAEGGLTYNQLMKTRCGGLQGIQRQLGLSSISAPVIPDLIKAMQTTSGNLSSFPFSDLSEDILSFNIRARKRP